MKLIAVAHRELGERREIARQYRLFDRLHAWLHQLCRAILRCARKTKRQEHIDKINESASVNNIQRVLLKFNCQQRAGLDRRLLARRARVLLFVVADDEHQYADLGPVRGGCNLRRETVESVGSLTA